MKKIWLIFTLLFILSSCWNNMNTNIINDEKVENEKIIDSETIQISELKDQPNF